MDQIAQTPTPDDQTSFWMKALAFGVTTLATHQFFQTGWLLSAGLGIVAAIVVSKYRS